MAEDFAELQERYRHFRRERDWDKYNDPKSLILALVGEVGELAELFQWVPADQANVVFADPERKHRAGEEMSDVLIYLMGLADALDLDLVSAAHEKLTAAEKRFPIDEVRGVAPLKK